MVRTRTLKKLITTAVILSFVAIWLNWLGILQYPFGSSDGTIYNIGFIVGLISTVIAIRLVYLIPES